MKTSDFEYNLPTELIAQTPLEARSNSRLLVLDTKNDELSHKHFSDIAQEFESGDVLVLNDTKVLPARLIGKKEETGAVIELLLLKDLGKNIWELLVKPAKRVKVGTIVDFGDYLKAKCIKKMEDGLACFEMIYEGVFYEVLDKLGTMPLPPYIHEQLKDQDRYQTVYAKNIGSAAAPTAGLHFSEELLDNLRKKGVVIAYLTLHVGLGTFRPLVVEDLESHKMHSEYYELKQENADLINNALANNHQMIVVGTTSVRSLEAIMNKHGELKADSGFTDIFIYPGYKFKIVNNLITNFHLPASSLIMLVSALAGREKIMNAYTIAVREGYRFFSFGDAMFIKGGQSE